VQGNPALFAQNNPSTSDANPTLPTRPQDVPVFDPKVKGYLESGTGGGQETLDSRAMQYLIDPKSTAGLGRGKAGGREVDVVQTRAAEIANGMGLTAGDIAGIRAHGKSLGVSLSALEKQQNALEAFSQTAIANGRVLMQLGQKIDSTGVPLIESVTRRGRAALGDPDVAAFNFQYEAYKAEVAKILTQSNMQGVLSDTARKEIEKAIQPGVSAAQLAAVLPLAEGDVARRNASTKAQVNQIMDQFSSLVQKRQPTPAAPAAPTAPAAPATDAQTYKDRYNLK
jgi:hypothetical protein